MSISGMFFIVPSSSLGEGQGMGQQSAVWGQSAPPSRKNPEMGSTILFILF